MVDKEERRAFGRFLTTASERELAVKRDELTRLVGLEPSFTELARDLRFLLRLTREEIEARECVLRHRRAQVRR